MREREEVRAQVRTLRALTALALSLLLGRLGGQGRDLGAGGGGELAAEDAALDHVQASDPERVARERRRRESSDYLAEHMQEAPVLVIPCYLGRAEGQPASHQASLWGSMSPAAWSFMLALRARGVGSAWTTSHLEEERDAAAIVGIPCETITQTALLPVAYTIGIDFKPGTRQPLDAVIYWNTWTA